MKKTLLPIVLFLIIAGAAREATTEENLGAATLTVVEPRIITPNGDQRNDMVFFKFADTIEGLPIDGDMFDVNGAKVCTLTMNNDGDALTWDGHDESGKTVPSGVYVYQIKIGQHNASGTVAVAR